MMSKQKKTKFVGADCFTTRHQVMTDSIVKFT